METSCFFSDFGVPLVVEPNSPQSKTRQESGKTKISIANSVNKQQQQQQQQQSKQQHSNAMRLEERQNKENENPLKDPSEDSKTLDKGGGEDNNVLYAQVSARLEPEGESRDTEDEADLAALSLNRNNNAAAAATAPTAVAVTGLKVLTDSVSHQTTNDRLYNYANIGIPYADEKEEFVYNVPKPFSTNDIDRLNERIDERIVENPEELYAAINKSGLPKKNTEFSVPDDEQWKEIEVQKTLNTVRFLND